MSRRLNKMIDSVENLAPIGVLTYTRLSHLRRTVESLQSNELAESSDLYIFSDAPKKRR